MRKRIKKIYWIKKLVKLRKILDDQAKADILLVLNEFKPTAMIGLSYFPDTAFSQQEFYKEIADLKKILQKLTLRCQLHLNYPKHHREITQFSYIAKDRKKLEKLIAADAEKNVRKHCLRLGALLGYPKTAVEAFANGKYLRHLPQGALKRSEIKFLNFRLSKHWQEELEYIKKRAEAIKRISPELYRRIARRRVRNKIWAV